MGFLLGAIGARLGLHRGGLALHLHVNHGGLYLGALLGAERGFLDPAASSASKNAPHSLSLPHQTSLGRRASPLSSRGGRACGLARHERTRAPPPAARRV